MSLSTDLTASSQALPTDAILTAYQDSLALLRGETLQDTQLSAMPPVPANSDPALVAMLKSWYEAGYHTGRFEALQEVARSHP